MNLRQAQVLLFRAAMERRAAETENEVPIQGFDQQAKKKEEAEGGTFCCSICRLEETYHCRGPVPYFCKTVRVSPDSYIARDPFMPPGQRSFLLLGSDCYACSKPVCQACSLFFAKRFCKPCAVSCVDSFPPPLKAKILQPDFLKS